MRRPYALAGWFALEFSRESLIIGFSVGFLRIVIVITAVCLLVCFAER